MKIERENGIKIMRTDSINIIGKEILQNPTGKYVVFGPVAALEAFANLCERILTDETNLEKIDNKGAQFVVADFCEVPFFLLVSRYGLQIMAVGS